MPAPRRGRRSPLVAIGAAVSLAGLSFYLYQRYIDSAPSADPRNDSSQSSGETSQSGRKVCLVCPETFSWCSELILCHHHRRSCGCTEVQAKSFPVLADVIPTHTRECSLTERLALDAIAAIPRHSYSAPIVALANTSVTTQC